MSHVTAGALTAWDYEQAAQAYLKSLPLEHFMEAMPQATQREITVESMALLKRRRREVQYFSELLVQYLFAGHLRQVVPDNMVIQSGHPADALSSYNLELERVRPLIVWEYVSPSNPRKDYVDSFRKYEQELLVPYYVLFYPGDQDLRVHHHTGKRYERMEPNTQGRCAVTELDLEIGLLGTWVRYWYRGTLLELPAELEERVEQQTQVLRQQAQQIQQQEQQTLDLLRGQIAERARQAGRTDILAQLAQTDDLNLINQWLSELG